MVSGTFRRYGTEKLDAYRSHVNSFLFCSSRAAFLLLFHSLTVTGLVMIDTTTYQTFNRKRMIAFKQLYDLSMTPSEALSLFSRSLLGFLVAQDSKSTVPWFASQ